MGDYVHKRQNSSRTCAGLDLGAYQVDYVSGNINIRLEMLEGCFCCSEVHHHTANIARLHVLRLSTHARVREHSTIWDTF